MVRCTGSFMAIRVFLGIAEGGMMPGIAYFLSTVCHHLQLSFHPRSRLALVIPVL